MEEKTMTLEIKTERRNLTFGSGEPAISHEEAINTLKAFLRAEQIAEMAKVACTSCDYDNNGSCDLHRLPGQCHNATSVAEAIYNADYRKQVEGEWTRVEVRGKNYAQVYYQHNDCKVNQTQMFPSPYNFCPNCGAKMK
jgi:hypothetical protein